MTFWKKLRLIGSVIVLVLAVVTIVGALMQSAPTELTTFDRSTPIRSPSPQTSGTKGL